MLSVVIQTSQGSRWPSPKGKKYLLYKTKVIRYTLCTGKVRVVIFAVLSLLKTRQVLTRHAHSTNTKEPFAPNCPWYLPTSCLAPLLYFLYAWAYDIRHNVMYLCDIRSGFWNEICFSYRFLCKRLWAIVFFVCVCGGTFPCWRFSIIRFLRASLGTIREELKRWYPFYFISAMVSDLSQQWVYTFEYVLVLSFKRTS